MLYLAPLSDSSLYLVLLCPCITVSPTTDCFFPSQEDSRGRSPQGQHQHQPDRLRGSELLCLPGWWGPRDPRRGRQRLCWKGRQQIESYCSCNQRITTFIYCFYCKRFFKMSIVNSNFFTYEAFRPFYEQLISYIQ